MQHRGAADQGCDGKRRSSALQVHHVVVSLPAATRSAVSSSVIAKLCNTIMKRLRSNVQPEGDGEGCAGSEDDGRRRFVSAQDVAERAGVSRSAVSRAFTPGASIAPATLARVQEAADALGYQVNDLARGLLAHRSRLVGLVTSDPETPFRAEMISGALPRLDRAGQCSNHHQRRPERRGCRQGQPASFSAIAPRRRSSCPARPRRASSR